MKPNHLILSLSSLLVYTSRTGCKQWQTSFAFTTLSALPEGLQVRPEHGPPIGRIDAYGGRVAHDALGHRCSGRRQVLCGYGTKVGGSCVEQPLPKGLPHRGKQVSKHASKQASK